PLHPRTLPRDSAARKRRRRAHADPRWRAPPHRVDRGLPLPAALRRGAREVRDARAAGGTARPGREQPLLAAGQGRLVTAPLLEVTDLVKHYETGGVLRRRQSVHALNGVSFALTRGETLGLVGESGSGKSTLGRVVLRLAPASGGSVRYEGQDVL